MWVRLLVIWSLLHWVEQNPEMQLILRGGGGGFYSPFHAMFVWWGLNQLRWSVCMILLSATLPQNNLNLAVCYPVPVSLQQLNLIARKLTQILLCATPSANFVVAHSRAPTTPFFGLSMINKYRNAVCYPCPSIRQVAQMMTAKEKWHFSLWLV